MSTSVLSIWNGIFVVPSLEKTDKDKENVVYDPGRLGHKVCTLGVWRKNKHFVSRLYGHHFNYFTENFW